jgi:asparagine synthase (glutamine-hydrolysing)
VLHFPGLPGEASLFRSPSGRLAVVEGYLFDRHERQPGAPGSEAAFAADAYDRWGDGFVERIAGGFAAVVWDEVRRRLVMGRDALGLQPCFYWWDGRVFLAAASLDAILGRREVAAGFNRLVIAEYLQDRISRRQVHETFYEDVRRLPPAHTLSLGAGALEVRRYWDPVPPGFAWASREETARFPSALERAVGRCLSVGADGVALSGGFDSVSVAALAAEQLRGKPPLHAVSLRFNGTVCDESETQIAVARALGMPQIIRTIEESLGGDTVVGAALTLSATSPSPVLGPWQSAYTGLLRSAGELGLGRLLLGTGGDDLLNVDLGYGADCLAALDLRGLWRFCRACQRTSPFPGARVARAVLWTGAAAPQIAGLGRAVLERVSPPTLDWLRRRRRSRALPPWASSADRALADALEARRLAASPVELAPGEGSYVRAIRGLSQAPLLLLERDQEHAWARQLGFTLLFPYFDRDLVELSLRIPPEELIAGGRHKAPLRRLVGARLPSVAMRAKKVDFTGAVHEVFRPAGRQAWRSLGGPIAVTELGLVDGARLDRFMADYFEGRSSDWLHAWLVLSTEAWLRARSGKSFTSEEQEVAA